jgi:hypothetical protein
MLPIFVLHNASFAMHFSLKHALAALTAVGIACGVVVQLPGEQRMVDLLWAAAAVAVLFAVRVCFEDAPRRGAAFGFVLGALIYFALAFAVPNIFPPFQNRPAISGWYNARGAMIKWHDMLSPANAVGVIVGGVLGAIFGAVAFRTGRRDR